MAGGAPRPEDILGATALIGVTNAAWELRLPQILASAGREGLSVAEIATRLSINYGKPSDDDDDDHRDQEKRAKALRRILRFLASHYLVLVRSCGENNEEIYSLPESADGEGVDEDLWPSLGPYASYVLHPLTHSKWLQLPHTVVNGSAAAAGRTDFYTAVDASDPVFRHVFDATMASMSSRYIHSLCTKKVYDMDPHREARTLVDLGGGRGHFAAGFARCYPHLTSVINFDLPHVIAAAPHHSGVEHKQGNMFEYIPSADIIFIKSVLHNWFDYQCIEILRNCHKSLTGCRKLVILDVVHENNMIDLNDISTTRIRLALDIVMLALFATTEGKERTKNEWGIILKDANFHNYKFIEIEEGSRSLYSIIEATIE